jgi:hypothetical protein
MKRKATKKRTAAKKHHAPATRTRTVVVAGHKKTATRRRRKVGATSSNMEMLLYTALGGVAAKIVSKTVENSTTLGLKPKTAGGFDFTPFVAPAIGAAAFYFGKKPIIKAMGGCASCWRG